MSANNDAGRYGSADVEAKTSEYNALLFTIMGVLGSQSHCTLVRVRAVTQTGTLEKPGYVDVQPLVNQLDGQGSPIPHGVINNVPFFRLQGGSNAVIIDPQAGDIGIAVFADRDISAVKATGNVANPGSARRSDMADGLYLGGFLNGVPSQYIQFNADGIKIVSPGAIVLEAQAIEMTADTIDMVADTITADASDEMTLNVGKFTVNGPSQFNGTVNASDTITAPDVLGGGKSLKTHMHTGVRAGTDVSGPPA